MLESDVFAINNDDAKLADTMPAEDSHNVDGYDVVLWSVHDTVDDVDRSIMLQRSVSGDLEFIFRVDRMD
jgi:hypothetical protein